MATTHTGKSMEPILHYLSLWQETENQHKGACLYDSMLQEETVKTTNPYVA